jgi:hypothetical protein
MTTRTSLTIAGGLRVAPGGVRLRASRAETSKSRAAATGMSRLETKMAKSTAKTASLEGLSLAHSKRRARP